MYSIACGRAYAADISYLTLARYQEGRDRLTKKEYAEAAIILRGVLKDAPRFSAAAIDLAKALIFEGRREEALIVLSEAADRESGRRKDVLIRRQAICSRQFLTNASYQQYQEGLGHLNARRTKTAADVFEKVLQKEPHNVEVLLRLGQSLILDNDFDSAAERLRLARRLNPNEPQLRLWLGRALHKSVELKEAIEELRAGYKGNQPSEQASLWLHEALAAAGQKSQAVQVLEQSVKNTPFHLRALLALSKLRYSTIDKDASELWNVRKDLQLALSRFEEYSELKTDRLEGDLGLDFRNLDQLRSEIQSLLQKIDLRLEQGRRESV